MGNKVHKLNDAIEDGKPLEEMKSLIKEDVVNKHDTREKKHNRTPLHYAVKKGRVDVVRALLGAKASTEEKDTLAARTPVFEAEAKNNGAEILKLLVDAKAAVDVIDEYNMYLVFNVAAMKNGLEMLKILHEAKANMDPPRKPGNGSPLSKAAELGYLESVKYLAECKASLDVKGKEGVYSPVTRTVCMKTAQYDVLKYLLEAKARVDYSISSPLESAMHKNHTKAVKMLLDAGASVPDVQKDKFLQISIKGNNTEVIGYLLDAKCSVNGSEEQRKTVPLYLAAKAGSLDVVKLLVGKNADVNAESPAEFKSPTPIMGAIETGKIDIIKYLIEECNVDINMENSKKVSAKSLADQYRFQHPKVLKYFNES